MGEGYRPLGRRALAEIIETENGGDRWLESLEAEDAADRRSGYYRRLLLTELSDIELFVPRTRCYCPTEGCGANIWKSSQAGVLGLDVDHAASTAYQISGAVLFLMRSLPSLN